jgi:hypothetical protein
MINRKLPTSRLKFKGIMDYPGLFKVIRRWYVDQGYEFHQDTLKHKLPSPAGYAQEIKISGWKKVNEYSKFNIKIYMHVFDIKEVEVVKEGKKTKLQHVRLQMEITPSVDVDYASRFGGSRLLQELQDFFLKYVYKEEIATLMEDQIWYRVYKLQKIIKDYFDFEAKTNAYDGAW